MNESEKKKQRILKEYLANLNIQIQIASYIRCPRSWRDDNFIPDYHRFYYILDGEGWLKVGNQEFHPQPGELYWLPAGVKQGYSTISDNTFLKYWCHFTTDINTFDILHFLKLPVFIKIGDNKIDILFKELVKNYSDNSYFSTLQSKANLLQIISYYLKNAPADQINLRRADDIQKIFRVLKYIEKNITRDISLEELADILHYHPNYFSNFFKTHLGKSPISYLNQLRINKARKMLLASKLEVKEIGFKVGFNSISYFSRYFKKETGLSPSEFREQNLT